MKSLKRGHYIVLASALVCLLALLFAYRSLQPYLQPTKASAQQWITTLIKRPVKWQKFEVSWKGFTPILKASNFTVYDRTTHKPILQLAHIQIEVAPIRSLLKQQLMTHSINAQGAQISLMKSKSGVLDILTGVEDPNQKTPNYYPLFAWLFSQRHIELESVAVQVKDPNLPIKPFRISHLTVQNKELEHLLSATCVATNGEELSIEGNLKGKVNEWQTWQGKLTTGQQPITLAPWLTLKDQKIFEITQGRLKNLEFIFAHEKDQPLKWALQGHAEELSFNIKNKPIALSNLTGLLTIKDNQLTGEFETAEWAQLKLKNSQVSIPNLGSGQEVMSLSGDMLITLPNDWQFLYDSPIGEEFQLLKSTKLTGNVTANLHLTIPLQEDPSHIRVNGVVDLHLSQMQLIGWPVTLKGLEGKIHFSNHQLSAQNLKAIFFDKPATLTMETIKSTTKLTMVGQFSISALQKALPNRLWQQFKGASTYKATLVLDHDKSHPHQLTLETDFKGISVTFPAPLHKVSHAKRPSNLHVKFGGGKATSLTLNYGHQFKTTLHLDKSGRQIDPLPIHLTNVIINGYSYGDVRFKLFQTHKGIRFHNIKAGNAFYTFTGQGRWDRKDRSHLQGTFHSTQIDALLRSWHMPAVITAKQSKLDVDLSWPGQFNDFAFERATGSLHLKMQKGNLLKLSKVHQRQLQLVHFLSSLDVASLANRLTFRWGDLFHHHMPFNRLDGTFALRASALHTDALTIDGPELYLAAKGTVFLKQRRYDLWVAVHPYVLGSTPLIAAIAGSPATGIALLTLNTVAKPELRKLIKREYHLQGKW